jgi:tetratricopeptide (TPR) repeat protein
MVPRLIHNHIAARAPVSTKLIDSPKTNRRWLSISVCIFLAALTWIVFGQTLWHEFVNYDDVSYLYGNSAVRNGISFRGIVWAFTHVHSQNWHPLTTISHMLDCQLFGFRAGWHHFISLLLHTAAVLMLFSVLRQMTDSPSSPWDESVSARRPDQTGNVWRSAFAAAVFAIHPLHVESVAWVAERKDVLSGLFFMLTLAAYYRYTRAPSVGRYVAVATFFACGLMSKPMLVTLPFVLLLLDYWPLARHQRSEVRGPAFAKATAGKQKSGIQSAGLEEQSWARLIIEKIPLFALSIASCVATLLAQNFALGSTEDLPIQWRITNAIVSYVIYVWQMIWPHDLVPFYVHPESRLEMWHLVLASALLVVVTAIAFALRRRRPYLIVGWLWYVVMLVPVIGLIQVGLQGHADRYTYLPQIGLYIAVTWLTYDLTASWRFQRVILASAAAIIIGALSILAWKQTTHWRNTESLWSYTLSAAPESDVAHTGLAGVLCTQGRFDDAISHYRRALQLRDGNAATHYGLAMALVEQRKVDEAIEHFKKALSLQLDNTEASNNLAVMYIHRGEIGNAIAQWQQTLAFDPDNGQAANNLAWVFATSPDAEFRDGPKAVELAERSLHTPGGENPAVLRTLAAAYAENNRFPEAVATAERGQHLAEARGDSATAGSLRRCADIFRRGEALHTWQLSN